MKPRHERQAEYVRKLEGENRVLVTGNRELTRELTRVTAQRDELRRVIGDVRQYAREEVQRHARDQANQVMGDALAASTETMNEEMGAGALSSDPPAVPTPSGPIHLAAHLADPGDPAHTGR